MEKDSFKVIVRDLDNKKDLNPTFVLTIGELTPPIYLSDLRTKFRKWLIRQHIKQCRINPPIYIISDFLKSLNAEISKPDLKRLSIAFGGDINKRILGAEVESDFVNI